MSWNSLEEAAGCSNEDSDPHRNCCRKSGNGSWLSTAIGHFSSGIFAASNLIVIFHLVFVQFASTREANIRTREYARISGDRVRWEPVRRSNVRSNSTQHSSDRAERNVIFLKEIGGLPASRCPMEPWIVPWAVTVQQNPQVKQFTAIEVGCNKATDALMLMRLFTQSEAVDMVSWLNETHFGKFACPLDWELWKKIVQMNLQGLQTYHHFCLEPVQENYQYVRAAAHKLGLDHLGLHVHQLALSSTDTPPTIDFPHARRGQEHFGIDVGARIGQTYAVNVSTLDKFVWKENIKEVNILKIDTEGNDARVLLGAVQTLTRLKPEYLIFENHKVGHWSKFDLKDAVDFLDNVFYTCFWATRKGTLVRLTGCWDARYSTMKGWSNVACYHRNSRELGMLMEQSCLDRQPGL